MRTLKDSAIFNRLIVRPDLLNAMKVINPLTDRLDLNDFQNEFNTINRRINYGTKGKAMELLEKNKIILINKDNLKIPKFINVFGIKNGNDISTIVNISDYIVNKEIYPKTLFALIQNGLISYKLANDWNSVVSNTEILKNACVSYSRMVTKIFDKLFALDIDNIKSDFISFVFAKFFLVNICDKVDSEIINSIALKACFNKTSENTILDLQDENEISYKDIFTLFNKLFTLKGLSTLNLRSFVENYVRMFGETSILSLDYLPSFFHTIFSSVISGGLVKDSMIDNVCGKFNNKTYTAFIKIL